MDPKISILIANYNNGHYFIDSYKSLISQSEKNWEAIIVDDASTDDSVEVIKKLIEKDKRFIFLQNDRNIGYQKSIVKAIKNCSSEIFGRLDPDDAIDPFAVEKSLYAHLKNPEVGLVYSNFVFCDENLDRINIHKCKQVNHLTNESYYNFNGEISHFATFKKNIYDQTLGIDTFNKRAEDKDIYMKMCEIAPVLYIDEDLYYYRLHNGGASTNKNSEKAVFWHWVALINMSERRNVNIEELFVDNFVDRTDYIKVTSKLDLLKKSRLLKLLYKLGLFKGYKYL